MKLTSPIIAFLISASLASAQVVVTDPIAHSLTRIDHAQNIAKYVCLEHLRRRRREVSLDPESTASSERWSGPEETFMRAEEHQENLRILAVLSSECRELFRLIFIEELTYKEVASRLGISEGAVKLRVRRCRLTGARLKQEG